MDPVEIFLYGDIVSESATAVVDAIRAAGRKPLLVRINSYGGDVFPAYAIYNALLAHSGGVTTQIDGLAASAAAFIAMAGNTVRMAENAILMIHSASQGVGSANAGEMRRAAEFLDKIDNSLTEAYVRRSKLPREKIIAMLEAETYFSAQEAKELGFVDEIMAPLELAASARSVFDNLNLSTAPEWVKQKVKNNMNVQAAVKYLVPDGNHLPYTDENGKPDHHLMGAAWAALHGGYRGNKYEGADKDKAIEKLKEVYKSEGMDTPKDRLTALVASAGAADEVKASLDAAVSTAVQSATKGMVPQAQFDLLKRVSDETKGLLDKAHTEISNLKTTVTGLTTERDNATKNVERLETLCQIKGIDPKAVVPPVQTPPGEGTPSGKYEKYQSLKEDEKNGKAKPGTAFNYWKANKDEIDKHAASLRKD